MLESIYILCKNSDLVALWKSQQHSPQMKKCPELRKPLGFRYPSQLALHGDGAPFLEHGSIQVLSMRCLLTKRSARHLLQSISQRLESKQKRRVHSKSLLTQAVRPKAPPLFPDELIFLEHVDLPIPAWAENTHSRTTRPCSRTVPPSCAHKVAVREPKAASNTKAA